MIDDKYIVFDTIDEGILNSVTGASVNYLSGGSIALIEHLSYGAIFF